MGGAVGGNPAEIDAGSSKLKAEASKIPSVGKAAHSAASQAASGVEEGPAVEMLHRVGTAWSSFLDSTETHMDAAARLAESGSADLRASTGGPRP